MKKYLVTLLLIVFIIPSVAFASWWNPFTWFQKNTQPHIEQISPVVNKPIVVPTVTSKSIPNTNSNTPKKETTSVLPSKPKEVPVVISPTSIIDVCKNIEGIQTLIPSGMILQNGNCTTPIPVISQPIPISLTTLSVTSITDNSAILNANLTSGAPANVSFFYGIEFETSKESTPVVYQFIDGTFSAQISGLKPNTTYYFYASAYNGSSKINSTVLQFDTPLAPGTCVAGQSWNASSNMCIPTPTTRCFMSETDYPGAPPSKLTCVPIIPVPTPTCSIGQLWNVDCNKCLSHLLGCSSGGF